MIWTNESIRAHCNFEEWPSRYSLEAMGEDGFDLSKITNYVQAVIDLLINLNNDVRNVGKFMDSEVLVVPFSEHSLDIYFKTNLMTVSLNYKVVTGEVEYYAYQRGALFLVDDPTKKIHGTFIFPCIADELKMFIISKSKPLSEEVL